MPPTYTFTAGMQGQWWGGGSQMLYSPWDSVVTERQSLQNNPVFVPFPCTSYLSHHLKWQDNMVRWHCFSFLPAYSHNVQGPEGVRTIPEEVVTRFPTRTYALPAPSAHLRQLIYKIRGLWRSVSQAESLLGLNQFKILQTIHQTWFIKTFNCG